MGPIKLSSVAAICLGLVGPLLAKRIIDCGSCGLEQLLKSPAIGIDINTEMLVRVTQMPLQLTYLGSDCPP